MWWKLDAVFEKLDNLNKKMEEHHRESDRRLDEIDKTLVRQEENLKEHMKRSEHLENIVENIQDKDLKPLARHVAMVNGASTFLVILGIVVGIISGILKIFGVI